MLLTAPTAVKYPTVKKCNGIQLVGALEIVIELADEAVRRSIGARHLGVEIRRGFGGCNLRLGLALPNHLYNPFAYSDVHVAMEDDIRASGDRAVARNHSRVGVREADDDPQPGVATVTGCASPARKAFVDRIATPILPKFSLPPVWSPC
jgi:hypothetical protein